jgi:hypothetical protein
MLPGTQAFATTGYKAKAGSSGSFSPTPTGVAVNNSGTSSDTDLYVVDGTTISEFTASGQFLEQVALPNGDTADRVAIDSSSTASAGDVYVTVPADGAIDELNIARGRSSNSPLVEAGLASPTGIAVDSAGNVYVAQSGMGNVLEFSSSGAPLNKGKPIVEGLTKPEGIAVDSNGDLYVADDSQPGTVEFTPTGTGGYSTPKTIDSEPAFDVAVDLATGNVFIAGGETIKAFNPSGSEIGVVLGSEGLLLNDYKAVGESVATGDVFALNSYDDALDEAEPEDLPERPITEACSGSVTAGVLSLCGTLNPHTGAKTGFYFAYSKGSSCKGGGKTPLEPEAEGKGIKVTSELTGVEPDTQYTYCLVGSNPQGKTMGQAVSVKTEEAPPDVDGESVSGVTEHDAILEAQINPNGLETAYQFRVVASPCHANPVNCELVGMSLFPSLAGQIAPTFGAQFVNLDLASDGMALEPDHEYHYAVLATSAAGSESGPDQTFTTPGLPPSTGSQGTNGTQNTGQDADTQTGSTAATQAGSTITTGHATTPSDIKPKALTKAQKMAKALKVCKKKRKRQRKRCEKQVREEYGIVAAKKHTNSKHT